MKRPNGKDYGVGVGYKNDVPFDPIGYNTALKKYIDYLETELNSVDLADVRRSLFNEVYTKWIVLNDEEKFKSWINNYC